MWLDTRNFVVERASDHSVAVDDVGHAGRAQTESALDVVQPPYLSCGVAPEPERSPDGFTQSA